ncbi:MAG: hypothetical protein AB1724_15175 [Thermodesulfobacteriota bacterium]
MPVIIKIIIFFIMLFGFFGVSWLWHWTWFGGEKQATGRGDDDHAAATIRSGNNFKLFTTGLVAAFLVGLYLSIFSLLN